MHICACNAIIIGSEWLVAWSAPSHYLNQCWHACIINWTLSNKLMWNFDRISYIFFFKKMHLKILSAKWGSVHLILENWRYCNFVHYSNIGVMDMFSVHDNDLQLHADFDPKSPKTSCALNWLISLIRHNTAASMTMIWLFPSHDAVLQSETWNPWKHAVTGSTSRAQISAMPSLTHWPLGDLKQI